MKTKIRFTKFAATLAIAAAAFLGASTGPSHIARAAEDPTQSTMGGTGPMKDEMTPELREKIRKGLDWLAKNMNRNGSMNVSDGSSPAMLSLAGLAFLGDGNVPGEGRYGKEVEQILDFVLKSCGETGLIAGRGEGSPMYGHGFATLFLAEVYGMTQRQDVKEKLQMAVRLIVQSQNKEGGWRYQPVPVDADLSVTICQVMALRAARNAGIKVPKKTIDMAIDYVKKSQQPDGGFSYTLQGGGSAFPRSAAGVACLFYSGIYEGKEIDKGVKYLLQHLPGTAQNGGGGHAAYGNYYATQAMFMAGGPAWEKYWPALRTSLMKQQSSDGSWSGDGQALYGTAMCLIALEVPYRLLPILQK
jgi:hypothetical protein